MKIITQLIIVFLFIGLNPGHSFSQSRGYNVIRISRISYLYNYSGKVKRQLEIDLDNNTTYYRKNPNRKFKKIETTQSILLFSDSLKIERIKQISKSITEYSEECRYHNEYGYYRIELLKFVREDLVYGETFLINTPYECKEEVDQIAVREYCNLITALFNEK